MATASQCYVPDHREGTLYYRLTRIKSVIFPIAGKGPCTKNGQVERMKGTRVKGPILKRRVIFPIAGMGPCSTG